MNSYVKGFIAVLAAILTAVVGYSTDEFVTDAEWINVAIAGVTAAGVFAAPNVVGAKYTKTVLTVLGAVLVALSSSITNGINQNELLQLGVVALGALGVYQFPNVKAGSNISNTGTVGSF